MNEGWIMLYRKFKDWEWFNISEMVHLFIYLLLSANSKDGEWRGIKIKRGQLLTGRQKISEQTKISERTIRTCLDRLELTHEIDRQVTNKYTIITICNYDSYQSSEKASDQQKADKASNKRPASDHKQEEEEEFNKLKEYILPLDNSHIHFESFSNYNKWLNEHGDNIKRMSKQMNIDQWGKLIVKFGLIETMATLKNMNNYKPLLTKCLNVYDTANNWMNRNLKKQA